MRLFLDFARKIVPGPLLRAYHCLLAFLGALIYRFPSREIFVVGITGTKGKTTVAELINAILEEAGEKTALSGTLRFKVGSESARNMRKMTMPGRFFVQKFIRRAVAAGCDRAILEMTSEGAAQSRHRFVDLDALVFTNLSPEHIESHGSYGKYRDAKLSIARQLERSGKKKKMVVANADDPEGEAFLAAGVEKKSPFSVKNTEHEIEEGGGFSFRLDGETIRVKIKGEFNLANVLAAVAFAKNSGIQTEAIKRAVEKFEGVPGRLEEIREGQPFGVFIDYAHTPDSLEKVYKTLGGRKICIFGATGGGRDRWKRKEMGRIADEYCERIILTDEDPYDEKPKQIVSDICSGFSKPEIRNKKSEIVMDRRQAIRKAFETAEPGDIVVITGKGTDPYIMGPRGSKIPWDDREVAREELKKLLRGQ